MKFDFQHPDWSNIHVLGRNRLPVRPFYCGYRSQADAMQKGKEDSNNYICLNGRWKFAYYTSPFYVPEEVTGANYDDGEWDTMPVPGHWQLNGYDSPCYNDAYALFPITDDPCIQMDNPTGVYRRELDVQKEEGKEYLLRFDGVESAYHVWVNGTFVGYSQGSRNTAEFDITPLLHDGKNVLAVEVYKYSDGSYLENQDMWWFAGIIRDVSMIIRPKLHLLDYKVESTLQNNCQDGVLRMQLDIENHTAQAVNAVLEMQLYEGSEKVWERSESVLADGERVSLHTEDVLENIRPWSAETPALYQLVMTLKADGKLVEAYSCKVGFRTIELKDGLFWVNGAAIKFRGVNRHDWNEHTGRCITEEDMRKDLYLMKQNNINAVRTSHYPPSPKFLDLCDELGLYVMEEADLECNQMEYTKNMNKLSDGVMWEASYVDRAEQMARRDKNHPSVLFWSLGNESGFGGAFVASGKFLHEYDATRLVHYEEDRDASIADVYSTMYTRHHQLELLGKDTTKSKPHVVCEYAHAMGNGPGGLKEYWEIFEKYPRLQGGFIWEWVDHGLRQTGANGKEYYAYGGDFEDYPNSGAFCCDGLIQANRVPTPAIRQVKKALAPVAFEAFDLDEGTITVHNKYDFSSLEHLKLVIKVHGQTATLLQKEMDFVEVLPQQKSQMRLFEQGEIVFPNKAEDWWLDLSVVYKERPVWAEDEQHETAFYQQLLRKAEPAETAAQGVLELSEHNNVLSIKGEMFEAKFDCVHGTLSEYRFHDELLLKAGLGMNFWRAPVDNDRNAQHIWEKGMLKAVCNVTESVDVEQTETQITIRVKQFYAPIILDWKVLLDTVYTILPDGRIRISCSGVPVGGQLPETFARIGMRFVLDKACEQVSWYGRGPLETYADCKEGNRIGRYASTVEDFYFPYVVPQETGNHEDTRWAAFRTAQNNTLYIRSSKPFSFSALHYTQEALAKARHIHELQRDEDITLCLDYKQHGLGSASWGAECLDKDRLHPDEFQFEWTLGGMRTDK